MPARLSGQKPRSRRETKSEQSRKRLWRTEHTSVEKGGDEVWIAEKFQSNSEIAGSPRNSFRASLEMESNGGKALN